MLHIDEFVTYISFHTLLKYSQADKLLEFIGRVF